MNKSTKSTRRELLGMGISALTGAVICSNPELSADEIDNGTAKREAKRETPWPERRKQIERKWLAGDCFSWFSFPGGHAFPGVTRRMTFAWFDRWLGRTMH